jgi:hypothetical protein
MLDCQATNLCWLYLAHCSSPISYGIREMLYNTLPLYIQSIIAKSNYKYFDKCKTISDVHSYFDRQVTNAGKFVTKCQIVFQFLLPEFAPRGEIHWNLGFDDTAQQSQCNMIIGRDLQSALGINILFSTKN